MKAWRRAVAKEMKHLHGEGDEDASGEGDDGAGGGDEEGENGESR